MSITSCKVKCCNIFSFELDIQLNYFISFNRIKYFDKINDYADRPYLVFSELQPETHIHLYIFFGLSINQNITVLYIKETPKKSTILN